MSQSTSKSVTLGKHTFSFPYEPYQIQKDFMSKILTSLENNENALLESPTGSGKTLSLLAPVLAYLSSIPDKPTVYFTSRTHSQLKQAIDQLRLLTTLNATTLASRSHLCLNKDVKDLPSGLASIKCKVKTNYKSKDSCLYYDGFKRNQKQIKHQKLADIEDLVSYGRKTNTCPYFTARALVSQVDFVFLPYNYLFDNSKKEHFLVNINVESGQIIVNNENTPVNIHTKRNGAIIIFDEAHNLESVALNSTSFEVSLQDLDHMMGELKYCMSLAKDHDLSASHFDPVHSLVSKIKGFIKTIQFPKANKYNDSKVIKDASCMYSLFNEAGLTSDCADIVEKAIELMTDDPTKTRVYLDDLLIGIRIMFMTSNHDHFKVSLEQGMHQNKQTITLKFYCLHSGIAMKMLEQLTDQQGQKLIKSFILASGTLSPLDSFAYESGLLFKQTLSNPHVIQPFQMCIQASKTGPLNHTLSSTFDKRDDPKYLLDLGHAITQISQEVNGGMLVFFPAYNLMEKCIAHWKKTLYKHIPIYNQLELNKSLYFESKNRDEFEQIVLKFEHATTLKTGAILFAVCRGKASEGIDFRNDKCRAVICIGFPFPNLGDAKVSLKRTYMDKLYNMPQREKGVVNGSEWYKQQAIRAINQAIGRVIRHKEDYGCIILLDTRFCDMSYKKYLPNWIRPYFKQNERFEDVLNQVKSFFRNPNLKDLKASAIATVSISKPTINERKRPSDAPQLPSKKPLITSRDQKKINAKQFMEDLKNVLTGNYFSIFKINLLKLNKKEMQTTSFAKEIIRFMVDSNCSNAIQMDLLTKLATFIPSDSRHHYLSIVNSHLRK